MPKNRDLHASKAREQQIWIFAFRHASRQSCQHTTGSSCLWVFIRWFKEKKGLIGFIADKGPVMQTSASSLLLFIQNIYII